jgi:hypothetical protein
MVLSKKKQIKSYINKTLLHPTLVMRNEMLWTLDFLIRGLEDADQRRGPHEVQTFHYRIILWGFIKTFIFADKIRNLRRQREKIKAIVATVTL